MKKLLIIAPTFLLSVAALAGCGNSEGTISLYDADSRLVVQSFDDKGSISLPTYRNKKTGEVPYAELAEFFYANGGLGNVRTKEVKKDDAYQILDEEGHIFLTADPKKETLTVENYELWNGHNAPINNGVGPDLGNAEDNPDCAVAPSKSTRYIGEKKPVTYDLTKWSFDIIEKEWKCYAPVQVLSTIFHSFSGVDLLYNGYDYYLGAVVSSGAVSVINRSYYATKGRFAAMIGTDAIEATPVGNEEYRYVYEVKDKEKTIYRIISLTKDGKGQLLTGDSKTDAGRLEKIEDNTVTYNWTKKNDALYLETFYNGYDASSGTEGAFPQGVQKIPLKEGLYGKKTRSKEAATFSYNILRFEFDRFYGLKDVANYSDFDTYAASKGLKDKLLSLDADTYDKALAELTMSHIDDGHTMYVLPSIHSGKFSTDGTSYAKEYAGARRKGLFAKLEEYTSLRNKTLPKLGLGEKATATDALGLFMQNSTAVIRFDEFTNPGIIVSNSFDEGEIPATDPKEAIARGNIPLAFDASFERIKKNKDIKNVVVDLTCNGGGMVKVVPYILAHFSDDPKLIYKDLSMDVVKEFHYKVDLNHDKVYGGEGDTYKGKYNFYILTSDFSFSCASMTPTAAKDLGVKIIGKKSGGGACSVGAFSDGFGSFFNISSAQINGTMENGSFKHFDGGLPVDHELDPSSWYDLSKLDTAIAGFAK